MNSRVRILSLLSVLAFSASAQTVPPQDSEEGAEDFEEVGTPTAQCSYQMGWVVGSYNATQTQDYDPSCVFHFRKPTRGLSVALIGNNHQSKIARTAVMPGLGEVDAIDMSLQDRSDNTLAGGRRGRQEVTACFLTSDQFKALSAQEQAFRRTASDIYKGCAPQGREAMFYTFTLSFAGGNPERMDAIVMQMHSVNDKDKSPEFIIYKTKG